jgi:hypothetical protein
MGIAETAMDGGDTAVKSAVETTGVEPAAMEPAAMEPAAMEPATVPAAMPSASTRMGEIWLAENSGAQ